VESHPDAIDLTIRNSGNERALIISATVNISRFTYLPGCMYGGDLPSSGDYQISLPDSPSSGQEVRATVHQEIQADGATRFRLTFSFPKAHKGESNKYGAYIYEIQAILHQDGSRSRLDVGKYIIAGPSDSLVSNWRPLIIHDPTGTTYTREESVVSWVGTKDSPQVADTLSCLAKNETSLSQILGGEGLRSSRLQEVTNLLSGGQGTWPPSPG